MKLFSSMGLVLAIFLSQAVSAQARPCKVWVTGVYKGSHWFTDKDKHDKMNVRAIYTKKLEELGHALATDPADADYTITMKREIQEHRSSFLLEGQGETHLGEFVLLGKDGTELDSILWDRVHWNAKELKTGTKTIALLSYPAFIKTKTKAIGKLTKHLSCQ